MIKKLLILYILAFSVDGISQPVANTPPDLESCGNMFDLTSQIPIILNGASTDLYAVFFHQSMMDAQNGTNPIANPHYYLGFDGEIIYARVQYLFGPDIDTTEFALITGDGVDFPILPDIQACDSYTLPDLPSGFEYYDDPSATNVIVAGTVVTATQNIYVGTPNSDCDLIESFLVTINATPVNPQLVDVTACDSFVLPALPPGCTYWSGPNGTGNQIFLGEVITTTMNIYVHCGNGECWTENSFTVTINPIPEMPEFSNLISCGPYTLPILPAGGLYSFNGVPLTGTQPFVVNGTGVITVTIGNGDCINIVEYMHFNLTETQISIEPLYACDDNMDGIAEFNLLDSFGNTWYNGPGVEISFHETAMDAQSGIGEIGPTYTNVFPFNQTIYVRFSSAADPDCFSISPLSLVAGDCANNSISGTVLIDINNNGCTATDPPFTNGMVSCTNGDLVTYAYTNSEGQYSFQNISPGSYTIAAHVSPMIASPETTSLTFTGANYNAGANFCVAPEAVNDAAITIIPYSAARPGFDAYYNLSVSNNGTTTLNGSVLFNFDDTELNYIASNPAPASQTTSSLTFNYNNLLPGAAHHYYVTFNVMTPPTVNAGDILEFTANVSTDATDSNLTNNTHTLNQTVVNSYDPNDITCHEGDFISPEQADDYLTYTIRFQNTGTAEAINIRLENELDELLDPSTFQPIASSHTYSAERDGRSLVFRYNNIMLEASSVNEPASHGFMTYRVKPLPGLEIGEVISNTADIFFDFNAPITTNTATTQIQVLAVGQNQVEKLSIYPNPASGVVNIKLGVAGSVSVSIVDLQGKLILAEQKTMINGETALDVSGIQTGMYILRVSSKDSNFVSKLIIR